MLSISEYITNIVHTLLFLKLFFGICMSYFVRKDSVPDIRHPQTDEHGRVIYPNYLKSGQDRSQSVPNIRPPNEWDQELAALRSSSDRSYFEKRQELLKSKINWSVHSPEARTKAAKAAAERTKSKKKKQYKWEIQESSDPQPSTSFSTRPTSPRTTSVPPPPPPLPPSDSESDEADPPVVLPPKAPRKTVNMADQAPINPLARMMAPVGPNAEMVAAVAACAPVPAVPEGFVARFQPAAAPVLPAAALPTGRILSAQLLQGVFSAGTGIQGLIFGTSTAIRADGEGGLNISQNIMGLIALATGYYSTIARAPDVDNIQYAHVDLIYGTLPAGMRSSVEVSDRNLRAFFLTLKNDLTAATREVPPADPAYLAAIRECFTPEGFVLLAGSFAANPGATDTVLINLMLDALVPESFSVGFRTRQAGELAMIIAGIARKGQAQDRYVGRIRDTLRQSSGLQVDIDALRIRFYGRIGGLAIGNDSALARAIFER